MHSSWRKLYETTERGGRTQHLVHLRSDRPGRSASEAARDAVAEQAMYGGWTSKQRHNVCDQCFEAKSMNGSCGCEV